MEEIRQYYRFRPDEIFRRVNITALVTLMLEQAKLEMQEEDLATIAAEEENHSSSVDSAIDANGDDEEDEEEEQEAANKPATDHETSSYQRPLSRSNSYVGPGSAMSVTTSTALVMEAATGRTFGRRLFGSGLYSNR